MKIIRRPNSIYGVQGRDRTHLVYHSTYGMNTSSWRPAAVYGVHPDPKRSQWYGLIDSARRGATVDTSGGGKITHVQDIADAMTLALDDESVAGGL